MITRLRFIKAFLLICFIGLANKNYGQAHLDSLVIDLAHKYFQKCNADWDENLSQEKTEIDYHKSFTNLLISPGFTSYFFDSSHHSFLKETILEGTKNDSINNLNYLKINLLNSKMKGESFSIFSISNCPGGNTSEYLNYGIIRINEDSCIAQLLDTINIDYFSPGYYKMETIKSKKETYYLLISISNSGIRKYYGFSMYQFKEKRLMKCTNRFPNDRPGVYISLMRNQSYNRVKKEFIPHYWYKNKTLKLKQYDFDSDSGFYKDTYQIIKLKFRKGRFKYKGKNRLP